MTVSMTDVTSTEDPPLLGGITEHDREFEALDRLLRGELSAVEAYARALQSVDTWLRPHLRKLQESHRIRSEQIRNRIELFGGDASESSGIWGAFARLFETGATLLGDQKTLEALEVGELHGLREYRDLSELEPATRAFVRSHLRPEQDRTYAALGDLIREAQAA